MKYNLIYWNNRVENEAFYLQPLWDAIVSESYHNNLHPNLLLGILAIEQANRGGTYRLIEHLLVTLLPDFVLKLDLSVGIAQIKATTLKRDLSMKISRVIIRKLMNPKYSIAIGAKLLSEYCKDVDFDSRQVSAEDFDEKLLSVVKRYTTGTYFCPSYPWILYYFQILKRICRRNILCQYNQLSEI